MLTLKGEDYHLQVQLLHLHVILLLYCKCNATYADVLMTDSVQPSQKKSAKNNERLTNTKSTAQVSELTIDNNLVLAEATLAASEALGLSKSSLGKVIGKDRSRLKQGIRIDSKPGELALLLIRCYRGLYALVDGDESVMRHWMSTYNQGTVGVPGQQVETVQGLSQVLAYLDAIRGKL